MTSQRDASFRLLFVPLNERKRSCVSALVLSLSLSVLTIMVMLNTGVSLSIDTPADTAVFPAGTHLAPGGTGTGFGATDNKLYCEAYNYKTGQPAHTAYWGVNPPALTVDNGFWGVATQTDWGLYGGTTWTVFVNSWVYSSAMTGSSGTTNP